MAATSYIVTIIANKSSCASVLNGEVSNWKCSMYIQNGRQRSFCVLVIVFWGQIKKQSICICLFNVKPTASNFLRNKNIKIEH